MASSTARTSHAKTGVTSVQVKWRHGGCWETEMFSIGTTAQNQARAAVFKADVEAAGNQWPPGWVKGKGYVVETPQDVVTFDDLAVAFFARQDKRVPLGRVGAHHVKKTRAMYRNHLKEMFGHMAAAEIEMEDVEDWLQLQIGEVPAKDGSPGAAPKSVRDRHGLLSQIFSYGITRMKPQVRRDNPCAGSELPELNARDARQIRFFQEGEWALFRSCLREDCHLLVDTKLATGVRWGEISALRVGDMAFDGDQTVIHIVRAWSQRADTDKDPIQTAEFENKQWKLGPPKNRRSRYVVITDPALTRALRLQAEGRHPSEFVFQTRHGNPWRYPDFYTDRWKPAREEAKARGLTKHATIHMLRHTAVVWSLARGVEVHKISEMIGHRSIQITYDIYGGLADLKDSAMAKAMAQALLSVQEAIVPAPSRSEVESRPVRTRRRSA